MGSIWAVARVTIREALRQKMAVALLVLLAVLLPALGFMVEGDATLPGQAQMFLDWSLRSSRLVLAFMTIFVSCATIAWELKYRQAYVTLTKPLARWQFLTGKWVGIAILNLMLLGCVGLVIEGFAWNFRGRPPLQFNGWSAWPSWNDSAVELKGLTEQQRMDEQRDRDILLKEVLVARRSLTPIKPIDQMEDEVSRMIEQRKSEGRMPTDKTELAFRQELYLQLQQQYRSVDPLSAKTFKFSGLHDARRQGYVQIRYRIEPGRSTPNEMMSYAWQVGVERKTEPLQYDRINEPVRTLHTLRVPATAISEDGELHVAFINVNPRNPRGTFAASAIFSGEKGLEVLYPVDAFEANLVRALLMVWVQLLFLSALGLFAASFLTFPTAALMCLLIFFAGSGVSYLLESISWTMKDDAAVVSQSITKMMRPALYAFLGAIPDFARYTPAEAMVDGRVVSWSWNGSPSLSRSMVYIGLVRTSLVLLIGCLILRRREVAQVVV